MSSLAQHLGSGMCAPLPGYHALTGSDYAAPLFRKSQIRPLSFMEKLFMPVFVKLGTSQILDPDVIDDLESFVCHLYGKQRMVRVDAARISLFYDYFEPREVSKPPRNSKGVIQAPVHHVKLR